MNPNAILLELIRDGVVPAKEVLFNKNFVSLGNFIDTTKVQPYEIIEAATGFITDEAENVFETCQYEFKVPFAKFSKFTIVLTDSRKEVIKTIHSDLIKNLDYNNGHLAYDYIKTKLGSYPGVQDILNRETEYLKEQNGVALKDALKDATYKWPSEIKRYLNYEFIVTCHNEDHGVPPKETTYLKFNF